MILHEPFTRKEQLAGLVSFLGVILIARPASLFSGGANNSDAGGSGLGEGLADHNGTASAGHTQTEVSPTQRLVAVGLALVGVVGATW